MSTRIYTFICSRYDRPPVNFGKLVNFMNTVGEIRILYDQIGIFNGYENGLESFGDAIKSDDIVVLCHDDIQIFTSPLDFKLILEEELSRPNTGFVGVAGTTHLGKNAMWWDPEKRLKGLHKGFVFQGHDIYNLSPNYFGAHGNVVCLDGLFLACKKSTIDLIGGLGKPGQFKNGWDFYDIFYTISAYEKGLFNRTVPILLTHYSDGMMRPTWDENRKEFCKMFRLPIVCK